MMADNTPLLKFTKSCKLFMPKLSTVIIFAYYLKVFSKMSIIPYPFTNKINNKNNKNTYFFPYFGNNFILIN